MLRIAELSMPLSFTGEDLRRQAAARLKVPERALGNVSLYRKSVDARKKNAVRFICTDEVEVDGEESGGWPVPRRVTVSGPLTEEQQAELTALIEAELAVPAEEQNYQIQEEP